MGSRMPSHIIGNGLFVSGYPEKPKEKLPTMWSSAIPYTGGDVRKSGELGKMFDIPVVECSKSRKSGYINPHTATRSMGVSSSSYKKKTHSCPLTKHGEPIRRSSGPISGTDTPMNRQYSGPQLPVTGLITSGHVSYNTQNVSRSHKNVSGRLNSNSSIKSYGSSVSNNVAVTNLGRGKKYCFRRKIPRLVVWASILLFTMGFLVGGFIFVCVHNLVLLAVVSGLFCLFCAVLAWNSLWWRKAIIGYINRYPVSDVRTAEDGEYVKIKGVVTCGNVPLRSSFQKLPRCVYTSTSLQEYIGCGSSAVTPTQRQFTWGNRFSEKHAVDFYISDFNSGLRALVKAGYGARVAPYVDEAVSITVDPVKRDAPPEFIQWLNERNIVLENRLVRLKEGCIKEGSTVSVMGMIQRNDNVLMIVAPEEAEGTGCQWWKGIFPGSCEGIVVRCEDTSDVEVIAV